MIASNKYSASTFQQSIGFSLSIRYSSQFIGFLIVYPLFLAIHWLYISCLLSIIIYLLSIMIYLFSIMIYLLSITSLLSPKGINS